MKAFKPFTVVAVPFPFTDRNQTKKRPALVLSSPETFSAKTQHTLLAMITSKGGASTWALDVELGDLSSAGLPVPSLVRMKLFTLDNRLILRELGMLATQDQERVRESLNTLLKEVLG
jgi:mRNA interferase MazF